MQIEYDRNGLKLIAITFFSSFVINALFSDSSLIFTLAFTLGVFIPIEVVILGAFLYNLLRFQKLFIYSNKAIIYFMIFLELIIIYDFLNN
jgi:hypothetical protein